MENENVISVILFIKTNKALKNFLKIELYFKSNSQLSNQLISVYKSMNKVVVRLISKSLRRFVLILRN